ncbi:MAG: hypothetical protein GOMPHAMPRED_005149 [Gomphillus americanus]|uniref:Uncharacterized protein n=1 Tax=Gomphillus americanus TaxID=1940652 RepID=A0A8H3FPP2_9LECA|nr:MAG: hypothetical protein GOMPHAMPRED_005149 [Gomphillus americanus]
MKSFDSNCPLPPEGTNFVSAPAFRGTLQILWTCVSVLVLCTWSVVHLNVPPQIKVRSKKQRLRRASSRVFSKIRWMLFNILAPEWIFTKALSDFLSVRGLRARFVAQAEKDGIPWSNAHTHFADMGGFGLSFDGLAVPQVDTDGGTIEIPARIADIGPADQSTAIPIEMNDNLSHDFSPSFWAKRARGLLDHNDAKRHSTRLGTIFSEANANGQGWHMDMHNSKLVARALDGSVIDVLGPDGQYHGDFFMNIMMLRSNLWIPNANQLLLIREMGLIASLPDIDEDDLDDRSKNNSIIKAIAITQICWFDLQFLVRFGTGMTNTQLEVMVFAFTIFSVISYTLAWDRPKGLDYTITLKATTYPKSSADMIKIAAQGPVYMLTSRRPTIWIANHWQSKGPRILGFDLPNLSILVAGVVTSIFGGLHCIAWHFSFPSVYEQTMWQASSIITTASPVVVSTLAIYNLKTQSSSSRTISYSTLLLGTVASFIAITLLVLFVAARLFILVEVFRSLGFQPPNAFKSTWTANLPHIG